MKELNLFLMLVREGWATNHEAAEKYAVVEYFQRWWDQTVTRQVYPHLAWAAQKRVHLDCLALWAHCQLEAYPAP
jgi:hypothetical protein